MEPAAKVATQAGYDAVAEEYAARFFDELAAKPLDRALLDCLVELTRGLGVIADMGCGPGQIARYLADHGAQAMGIDLSPEMVRLAQRLSPDIPFRVGDMLALDLGANSLGGIAAFYSVIHAPPDQIPQVMREFYRVLRLGGLALLAFHIGDEVVHRTSGGRSRSRSTSISIRLRRWRGDWKKRDSASKRGSSARRMSVRSSIRASAATCSRASLPE